MKKSMWRRAGALLLLGALAGCAGYEWRKEGTTREQRMRDEELCERHAQSIRRQAPAGVIWGPSGPREYYGPPPGEEGEVTQRFVSCMEARGYRRLEK